MEAATRQAASGYHHYGSDRHKQVYLYGRLNTGPTTFERAQKGMVDGYDESVPMTDPISTSRRLTPMRRHNSSVTGWPVTVVPKSQPTKR